MEKTIKFNVKKAINIALNVLLWLFVAFAVVVTVIAISAVSNKKNIPTVGGTCYLNVLSGSMDAPKPEGVPENKPSGFKEGDLIFSKYINDNQEEINKLEVGDVITFELANDGKHVTYNTHRIIEIIKNSDGEVVAFETLGDNPEYNHGTSERVPVNKVLAVYTGNKLNGFGDALEFLSGTLGFGLCILLPMVLFFGYELFVFIRTLLKVKNEGKKVITAEDEELIKQRAIEEYLKRKQEEEEKTDN